jgi:hypothetical protein
VHLLQRLLGREAGLGERIGARVLRRLQLQGGGRADLGQQLGSGIPLLLQLLLGLLPQLLCCSETMLAGGTYRHWNSAR